MPISVRRVNIQNEPSDNYRTGFYIPRINEFEALRITG